MRIGILDDSELEITQMEMVIDEHSKIKDIEYTYFFPFKEIEIEKDMVKASILSHIIEETIDAIIINESIVHKYWNMKGSEIFLEIEKIVPKFPSVILTNYTEQTKENRNIDSDKIYFKKIFLDISDNQSAELVNNFIRNIINYIEIKKKLESERSTAIEKYINNPTNENLGDILEIESNLKLYKYINHSEVESILDKEYNKSNLADVLKLIDSIERIVDDE